MVADIIEFQPPTMTESAAFLFLLGVAVLLLLSTWRRLEVSEVLLLVGFGGAALHERRNMVECLVVLAPLLAARLQDAVDGLARHAPPLLARTALARGAPWLIPPLVLAGGLIAADQPPGYFLRRIQLGENPYRVPSSAAAFVRDHAIAGRCFTSMDLGGFVEWELSDSKVFHDPRLVAYPDELFDELGKAEGNPAAFSALVDKYGIEWSLRSNRNLRFSGVGVFPQERWALVYWDDAASVRVRRDVARFADLVRDSEIREFLPGSSEGELWAASRGERRARLVSEFEAAARLHPTMSAPHTGLCFDLASRREFARAERECDLATQTFLWRRRLEPSEGSRRRRELAVAWTFLGQAALGAGDVVAARRSLEAALEVLPGSGASLAGLGTTWLTEDPARARDLFRRALSAQPGLEQAREGLAKACQTAPGPACPPPAPPP